jgi:glycosyltransferase involved in cell wall biosynthesis
MRVLFLSDLETVGGAAIAASRLAQGLSRLGVEVVRVSGVREPQAPGAPPEWRSCYAGLPRGYDIAVNGMRRLAPALARRIGGMLASHALHGELQRMNFDILHVHAIHNSYWNHQTLVELSEEIPTVWTFHDFWGFSPESYRFQDLDGHRIRLKPDGDDRETAMQRRLQYFASRRRLRLIGNSAATTRLAQEALNLEVRTIHYGLPLELFRPLPRAAARLALGLPPTSFVIGFSADTTSDPVKGFKVLESALTRLDLPDTHALAMGSGAWADYQIGSTHVLSLGRVDNPRLQAIVYSAADVFVVPSLAEALGQVAMEAIASGTPVLASRTGGLVDIVLPDRTGWLFDVGNSGELHALLTSVGKERSQASGLRETCRKLAVDHWSIERQAQDYLKVYDELLSVPAPG